MTRKRVTHGATFQRSSASPRGPDDMAKAVLTLRGENVEARAAAILDAWRNTWRNLHDPQSVTLTLEGVGSWSVSGDHADTLAQSVAEFLESFRQAAAKRARWGEAGPGAMEKLCALFPMLRDVHGAPVPGTLPWDAVALDAFTAGHGFFHDAGLYAAWFVLRVWNAYGTWESGASRFDLWTAWGQWDDAHRAAAMAWLRDPFYP